jgi:hypothetical protein
MSLLIITRPFGVLIGINIMAGAIDAAITLIKIQNVEEKKAKRKPLKRNMSLN